MDKINKILKDCSMQVPVPQNNCTKEIMIFGICFHAGYLQNLDPIVAHSWGGGGTTG